MGSHLTAATHITLAAAATGAQDSLFLLQFLRHAPPQRVGWSGTALLWCSLLCQGNQRPRLPVWHSAVGEPMAKQLKARWALYIVQQGRGRGLVRPLQRVALTGTQSWGMQAPNCLEAGPCKRGKSFPLTVGQFQVRRVKLACKLVAMLCCCQTEDCSSRVRQPLGTVTAGSFRNKVTIRLSSCPCKN